MAVVTSPVIGHDLDEILDRDLPWDRLSGSTVLVAGASGMLPSYAVYALLALNARYGAGITVHGLVRNEAKARRLLADVLDRPDFHLVVHDVTRPLELPGPLDYVIHGASAARPVLHGTEPVATIKANLLGSFHLLDLSVAKRSRGFALMSSAEVYGAQPTSAELIEEQSYSGFDILAPRPVTPRASARRRRSAPRTRRSLASNAGSPASGTSTGRGWPSTTAGYRPTSPRTSSPAKTSYSPATARRCARTPTSRTRSPGCSTRCCAAIKWPTTSPTPGDWYRSGGWPSCSPRCAPRRACGWFSPTSPPPGPTARPSDRR